MAELLSQYEINKLLSQIDTKNTEKNPTESTKSQEETINEIVALLKNNKVDQVVIHGNSKITNGKGEKKEVLTLDPDLDARTALYLLNDLNNKSLKNTYEEGAMTSFIPKTGSTENLTEKDGLRVFIDTGGNWLKVEKNEKTTTIHIDHHGSGKREPTSATKMMYEIMEKADLLKEKPEWLKKFVNLVNEIDNLTYLNKKDKWGKKTFDAKFFQNEWPYTLYALAENIPFETLLELCKSGKIKDLSAPLTEEQLSGEIGKIKTKDNIELAEKCEKQAENANITIENINNAIRDSKEKKLNLVTESLGKIVYHNFPKIELKNGKKITNKILNNLAFIGTKALGGDTYICWNEQQGKFFINSHNPNLSKIVEELNKLDPGSTTDIRGEMVFGKIKNLNEKQFLDTIDPNILKDAEKIIEPQEEKPTVEDFKQIIKENEESIEKYKNEKEIIEAMITKLNYNKRKNNDEKVTEIEEKEWGKLIDDLEKKRIQIKDAKKTITEAKNLLKIEEEKENSDKTQTTSNEKEDQKEKIEKNTEIKKEWTEEDEKKLNDLLSIIENTKKEIGEIQLELKKRQEEKINKEKNKEVENIESFDAKFIENKIHELLKQQENIKKINNLKVEGFGSFIGLRLDFEAKDKKFGIPIKIEGIITTTIFNKDDTIVIKKPDIQASMKNTVIINKMLTPKLDKVIKEIIKFIEKEKNKKIEKIWIEDGQLKAKYK